MQQLARKFAAEFSFDFGSVIGEVKSPRPTPLSMMREALADGQSVATAMLGRAHADCSKPTMIWKILYRRYVTVNRRSPFAA